MSSELSVPKPDYLAKFNETNVDNSDIAQYSKPPRIKVVQALSQPPIKPPFKEGDVIVVPQMMKIGDFETPFTFVPIIFFPTWICLNPIQMKGTLKSIREFSMDPKSEVARKCKAFVKEKCPENPEYYLKHQTTLNFLTIVEDNEELKDLPIHLFFSRGSYQTGESLIAKIQSRPKAPRYAMRFRAAAGMLTSKQYTYPGLVIENDPKPWVAEENFVRYEKLYLDLKKLIDEKLFEIDAGEDTLEEPVTSTEF